MRKSLQLITSLLCLIMAMSFIGTAQAQDDLAGKRITSITVKYRGHKTVATQRILDNMSSKVGQPFSADKIDDDIKNLVAKGLVEDVAILADPGANTLELIVVVNSQSLLGGVGFANNTKFNDKDLLKGLEMKPGTPITDALILTGRNKILEKYNAFGYPDVVVSHTVRATKNAGYSDLIYTIAEGQKSVVRKIKFAGNRAIPSHKLRNLMKTKQKGIFSFITKSGNIDLDKLEDDRELILAEYKNRGYLRVSAPEFGRIPLKDGRVDLVLNINEGAKYTVNRVAFSRIKVFKPAELAPALTLVTGRAYSVKKIKQDIKTIRSYYGSKGYADANVKPVVTNAGPGKVNVAYQITEGSFYRVGRVNIAGNNKTRDRVIRQEIPLKPGDNFNTVDVETTRKRLQNLDYFGSVYVSPSNSSQKGQRNINVTVTEKKTGNLNFGLGFSSVDSIVGYINLEQRNFDISNPWNFTGGGQRFAMNLKAGAERQDFSVSLTEPWFLGQRLSLGGELYYKGSQYYSDVYDQRNVGAAIKIRKPLSKLSYLKAAYRLEKIRIDVEAGASPAFQAEDGDFLRSVFSLNYVYDSRDALSTPRSGHKVDLGIEYSGLGGDVDTVGFSVMGSKHWNLWWDSIFTVRGAANVMEGNNVQIFDRQFLGGPKGLRGFEKRDVGPGRDTASGEVLGGNTSVVMTAEMTFPVVENVRVAAFYDLGFVNAKSFDFDPDKLHADVGFGLRLNLPFGPVGLDYAIPIRTPDAAADKGGQFHFYVDYEF